MDEIARLALTHVDALHNFARWLSGDAAEAEDLVQETFAKALGAATRFAPGTDLRAWLFRILRNCYLDRRRRWRREAPAEEDPSVESESTPGSAEASALEPDQLRALAAAEIAQAVHALPELWRTVILLDLQGMTEREIAEVLGCAEGTVKSRLYRARAALRGRLAPHRPGGAE